MPQGIIAKGGIGNSILYAGTPLFYEREVLTATDCYPGRLVEADTTDYQIKVGADNSVVILGVLDRESDEAITTIYHAGDQARVLHGDIVVWVLAISGATIARGTRVQCAGSGKVDQYATATADVGYSLHAKSGSTAGDEWILIKLTI